MVYVPLTKFPFLVPLQTIEGDPVETISMYLVFASKLFTMQLPEPMSGGETVNVHPFWFMTNWIGAATGVSGFVMFIAVPAIWASGAPCP